MSPELLTAIGGAIASFLIGLGVSRTKVSELERRVAITEKEVHKQFEFVHGLRDVYVSYQHFNEIMNTIRDTQRELREDMKKVLELLSVRI